MGVNPAPQKNHPPKHTMPNPQMLYDNRKLEPTPPKRKSDMDDPHSNHWQQRRTQAKKGCGCLEIPTSLIWLLFTLMYFFTEADAFPIGKWEFLWRFFAGPFNFLF